VLGRGVQEDAHLEAGAGEVGEPFSVDGRGAGRRDGQTHHDAHRGGLAGAVRAEEAGDAVKETLSTAVKPAYLRLRGSTMIMGTTLAAAGLPPHRRRGRTRLCHWDERRLVLSVGPRGLGGP
jgi:hypothetical protein